MNKKIRISASNDLRIHGNIAQLFFITTIDKSQSGKANGLIASLKNSVPENYSALLLVPSDSSITAGQCFDDWRIPSVERKLEAFGCHLLFLPWSKNSDILRAAIHAACAMNTPTFIALPQERIRDVKDIMSRGYGDVTHSFKVIEADGVDTMEIVP